MAILSAEELFSDQQAITATAASTNLYDRLAPGSWVHGSTSIVDDMGNSYVPMLVQVTEDFNNLTSLQIDFEMDTTDAFSSATTLYSETVLLADLVAGKKIRVRWVPHDTTEQYLRFNYTVTGTAPSTGKLTAGFICSEDSWGTR